MREVVVVRGAGDLATGVGYRLHRCGFKVLMLEIEKPLVIRRTVSYAQSVYDGETVINGVKGIKVSSRGEIESAWEREEIPVLVDEKAEIISERKPKVVVDAILAKKNLGTNIDMAEIVIAMGPGFTAGVDVDAVVETKRGHYLGSVILEGTAIPNTGVPGTIGGYDKERVIHSPADGKIEHISKIGDRVEAGQTIAKIGDTEVVVEIAGVLRGLIQDGLEVQTGLKIADVDPRGEVEHCFSISDKAFSIAGGVLEAIMYKMYREKK
jgi:xanthine dehydrogenase accessory factor